MLVLLIEGIYEVAIEMALCDMIYMYVPRCMKIGIGVQAILKCCLRNLRGCSVGITGGRDLLITPLR
jgi:hypothetical protein